MPKRVADLIDNNGFYKVKRLAPNSNQQDNKQKLADQPYYSDYEPNSPAASNSNPAPTLVQIGLPPAQLDEFIEAMRNKELDILVSDIKSCKAEVFCKVLKELSHDIVKLTLFKVPQLTELPAPLPNLQEIMILADMLVTVPWLPNLFSQKKSTLTTITLNSIDLVNLDLDGASIKLPALKTLKLIYCTGSLNTLISGCTVKLRSLEIRHAGRKEKPPKPTSERERALAIYFGTDKSYTHLGITELSAPLTKLSQLTLHDCWDPAGVDVILKNAANNLQYLHLRNVDLTQTGNIHFPKVKTAILEFCKYHDDIMSFNGWLMLENLKIGYSDKLTLRGKNLSKMKNMELEYSGPLTGGDVPDASIDEEIYDKYNEEPANNGEIDFEDLLESCSNLEHLILKGVTEDVGNDDWVDHDDKDWMNEASTENTKCKLKSITMKSCLMDSMFLKYLLLESKSTLQTINLQDVDMSMLRSINVIKFPKLKQVILRPRYTSLQGRQRRSNVNQGIVDLLKACSLSLEELEMDSVIDVYDLKKLQATQMRKLKECRVKGVTGQQFTQVEEQLIQTIFAA